MGSHHNSGRHGQRTQYAARTSARKPLMLAAAATLCVGFVIALISTSAISSVNPGSPEHGKVLYKQYCSSCHGSSGQGEFNWMNRDRAAPPLDSTGHAWHHEDAQLVDMILNKPAPDSIMPAWSGVLTRNDAIDLVAYIKTLWTPYIRENCQGAKHMSCMGMR